MFDRDLLLKFLFDQPVSGIDVVIGGRSYEKARRAFPAAEFKCVDIFDANLSKQFVGIDLVINTAGK